jgi:hypothetical protein
MNNNKVNNLTNKTVFVKKTNSYGYFIIYFAILVIFSIILWQIYKYLFPGFKKPLVKLQPVKKVLTNDYELEIKPLKINLPDVSKNDELGITFGFKIYIDNTMENENWGHRYDQLKPIINYSPSIYYHPSENYFEFNVEVKDNIQMSSFQSVKYVNPPLQKWLSIIAVFASNKILVYVNQELVISKKLKNPPFFKQNALKIGQINNNLKGTLGPVVYWGYPLDISEIQKATFELEYIRE